MEIVETYTTADAVAQGARLLDEKRPGWEHTVRGSVLRGEFNISSWETCIAGTLELWNSPSYDGDKPTQWISFNGLKFHVDDDQAIWVGFTLGSYAEDVDWDELDALWMAEVDQRIGVEAA